MKNATEKLRVLLHRCAEKSASDLHLSASTPPIFRLQGLLHTEDDAYLSLEEVEEMALSIMTEGQRRIFEEEHTIDIAFSLKGGARFRINVFRERGRTTMAIRRLDDQFCTLEELNLPSVLDSLAKLRDGLVLFTGPTGSGKTTSLATLIHQINSTRSCHILTIEDPVEYIHGNIRSLVHQREVNTDVAGFAQAVRAALREDPDVILVGEMRDLETMRAAITAAETGHLVFSTLHCGDAVGALERIIGMFPPEEQSSVCQQLSMTLRAVVAQRLLQKANGEGRVPATEILLVTSAVANLVRAHKPEQLYSSMELGAPQGMQTMEQSLAELIAKGLVAIEEARKVARDTNMLDQRIKANRTRFAGSSIRGA